MSALTTLCFHRVVHDHDEDANWPWLCRGSALTALQFRKVLERWSATHRWVTEDEVLSRLDATEQVRRASPACWVTFDDGYRDNLAVAAPILREFGIRPTLFLTTDTLAGDFRLPVDRWYDTLLAAAPTPREVDLGHGLFALDLQDPSCRARLVGGPEKQAYVRAAPPDQKRMLTRLRDALQVSARSDPGPRQPTSPAVTAPYLDRMSLLNLAQQGWLIGAHGKTHRLMPTLDDEALLCELSADVPAGALPPESRSRFLAWPDGAFDRRCEDAADRLLAPRGIRGALTIDDRRAFAPSNRWALPRKLVTPEDAR